MAAFQANTRTITLGRPDLGTPPLTLSGGFISGELLPAVRARSGHGPPLSSPTTTRGARRRSLFRATQPGPRASPGGRHRRAAGDTEWHNRDDRRRRPRGGSMATRCVPILRRSGSRCRASRSCSPRPGCSTPSPSTGSMPSGGSSPGLRFSLSRRASNFNPAALARHQRAHAE